MKPEHATFLNCFPFLAERQWLTCANCLIKQLILSNVFCFGYACHECAVITILICENQGMLSGWPCPEFLMKPECVTFLNCFLFSARKACPEFQMKPEHATFLNFLPERHVPNSK